MANDIQRPKTPRDPEDLKRLLQQYDKVLTPQNKAFINELISKLENNATKDQLRELADRMRKATVSKNNGR